MWLPELAQSNQEDHPGGVLEWVIECSKRRFSQIFDFVQWKSFQERKVNTPFPCDTSTSLQR